MDEFKELLKNRINHCKNTLVEKMKNEQVRNEVGYVFFQNGTYFNKTDYKIMVNALRHKTIDQWNTIVWQQIATQAYFENKQRPIFFEIIIDKLIFAAYKEEEENTTTSSRISRRCIV